MGTVGCVDELRRDTNAVAGAPHAAFQDGPHTKGFGDLANILLLAVEREGRRAGVYFESLDLRQQIQDFLG
jgi:hypothetical protein